MIRKKVCFEIEGGNVFLHKISDEEKTELESFLQETPLEFYLLRELLRLRSRFDEEFCPQWIQKYEFLLDTAKSNHLIDQFPTKPRYLYVKEATGTVLARFDSQNEPSWTLAAKDQFRMPFDQLYLTFAAQADKCLIFYVSNREILRTTLA